MSHEIIKNIFVTADRRVIVCHASSYLFFLGVWQNDLRHGRAVARAIEQERMDVYELWKRCDRDVSFRREFIRHLATYLEPLTVELPNL